jgi:alkanesulfonate monooxygenase SsuD/methylene tetrahydromethanopterin reductase-like flavin-dependent oxidoreductase (luciferase family)
MAFTLLRQGRLVPVPRVERALEFLAGAGPPPPRRWVVGSPDTVRAGLEDAAAEYEADAVMLVTITYDHEARRRSYELVAGALALAAPAVAAHG